MVIDGRTEGLKEVGVDGTDTREEDGKMIHAPKSSYSFFGTRLMKYQLTPEEAEFTWTVVEGSHSDIEKASKLHLESI